MDARDGILDGSANCPTVRIVNHVPDPDALGRVFADPNCFSFQEMFPGGFTPQFGGLSWDASGSVRASEVDFFINDTVKASLGPDTPTEFKPGLYRQEDFNVNFDIAYDAGELAHFAAGAEVRNEGFTIEQGQSESWQFGPYAPKGSVPRPTVFWDSARLRSEVGTAGIRRSTLTSDCPMRKTATSWAEPSASSASRTSARR